MRDKERKEEKTDSRKEAQLTVLEALLGSCCVAVLAQSILATISMLTCSLDSDGGLSNSFFVPALQNWEGTTDLVH